MKVPAPSEPAAMPARVRTIIVDDEPAARRGMRLLLEQDPDVELVGEAGTGAEAVALIERERPALAFLDVQLPAGDGFETLARVGAAAPVIVFVTAHDGHARRAFEVNAIDYLLKPYADARFRAALERAKGAVRQRRGEAMDARLHQLMCELAALRAAGRTRRRVVVKTAGEILFLHADEIDWVEAEGDYVKFHAGNRSYLMRETMGQVEARLPAEQFVRVHRSAIVNLDRLQKLSPLFGGDYAVILRDGTKLKLSRGYHERIESLLK